MKNQWFGDIHDFRKYGLLRFLSETQQFRRIMVAWMLTLPQKNDPCGKYRGFVNRPGLWSKCDAKLFDILKDFNLHHKPEDRKVIQAFQLDILSSEAFCSLGDSDYDYLLTRRDEYFSELECSNCDLIFLDADNGLEVKSMSEKKKPQYILYREIDYLHAAGKCVLIYQHRAIGQSFESQIAEKIKNLPKSPILVFRGGNVSYILLCQKEDQKKQTWEKFREKNFPEDFLRLQNAD